MSRELSFIARLRGHATDPAARGLLDDAAVLPGDARALVLTHDMIVEGVHFLPTDPPADVAWKLLAVNLSDLAAKGAVPAGVLLGYPLAADAGWDERFADGLAAACARWGVPLLGGDTVAVPPGSARQLGLSAIGRATTTPVPGRGGAQPGDRLAVSGTVGGAGLGLAAALAGDEHSPWLAQYRRPEPQLALGQALAPLVHAMADVSDGLLIDARRLADASGCRVEVALDRIPLPAAAAQDRAERLRAATAGDDYQLLAALPARLTLSQPLAAQMTEIGRFRSGSGLVLTWAGATMPLPDRLGFLHGAA